MKSESLTLNGPRAKKICPLFDLMSAASSNDYEEFVVLPKIDRKTVSKFIAAVILVKELAIGYCYLFTKSTQMCMH